ncbi:MAG: DegV family protein [Oscillospiraceae bacterium]|nr:DegV family protein [Oscillospiraceae bacterium]
MKILISADSTCDLGPVLTRRYDVRIMPLYVNKGGKMFRDGVDIQPNDLYAHVANGGDLCSTAAANVADYLDFFTELRKEADAVIHLCISAHFSSTYQNACIAAQEVDGVYVVDSRNLSTGHGHLVLMAADAVKAGGEPEAIAAQLRKDTDKVRASFVLEQLAYMRKGGRCSTVAALGANLLNLKPSIRVTDGAMAVAKKYRGNMEKCIRQYVNDELADLEAIRPDRVFITHSGVTDMILQAAQQEVEKRHYFKEILITHAGCTVCSHCGPGTLGVLYVMK